MSFSVTGRFWGRVLSCLVFVILVQVDVLPSKANPLNIPWHDTGVSDASASAHDGVQEGEAAKRFGDAHKAEHSAKDQIEAAEASAGDAIQQPIAPQKGVLYTRVVSELVKTFYIA